MPYLDDSGVTQLTEEYRKRFMPLEMVQESDGYARGGLAEVTAKGHAEQVATTGKNLLPNTATSQTKNGITFTVNADGSVTVNGTATANAYITLQSFSANDFWSRFTEGATYRLSGCPDGGASNKYYLRLHANPWRIMMDAYDMNGRSSVITRNEADTTYHFILNVDNGQTVSNLTFYPQLELGSTATEYEPYTGGAPSPSPDYPQEIQVVRGRNLFDKDNGAYIDKASMDNNTIIIGYSGRRVYYVKCESNTTYSVSRKAVVAAEKFVIAYTTQEPASAVSIFNRVSAPESQVIGNLMSLTITTGADAKYLVIWAYWCDAIQALDTLQIELGSTPTPYVPYGHVGMEVESANFVKRIFAGGGIGITASGVKFINDGDGISVKGTTTDNYCFANLNYIAGKLTIPPGTYVASGGSATVRLQVMVDGSVLGTQGGDEVEFTIPPTASVSYMRLQVQGTGTVVDEIIYPMVRLKSVGNIPYVPYFHTTTPIPLPSRGWVAGLPDGTADTLTLDGAGKVEWEKSTEEVVLDGSEDWELKNSNNSVGTSKLDSVSKPDSSGSIASNLICSNFARQTADNVWSGRAGASIGVASVSKRLRFADGTKAMTVANWTTWLSSHPITVLYPLATPVTEHAGYVEDWPTDIPEGAVIDIPELSEVGIKYFIDSSVTELAKQWYERANSEYEDRLEALEAAVADLVTGA